MVEYTKVNFKLSDSQLKNLKGAVSNNTGTTLRISFKMFNGKTKIRNGFNNNTSTNIKRKSDV